jgi:hypothetical protein
MLHRVAMIEQSDLIDTFLQVANLAHVHVAASDVRAELLPAPHKRPSNLPSSSQVVYAFLLGDRCLKVGKAGPKSQAALRASTKVSSVEDSLRTRNRGNIAPTCRGVAK